MKKYRLMKVDPEFADFIDECSDAIAKEVGVSRHFVGARVVTNKIIKKIKKNKERFEI